MDGYNEKQLIGGILGGVIHRAQGFYGAASTRVNFLLADNPAIPQKRGRPAAQHAAFQDRVVDFANLHPELAKKLNDPTYLAFLRNMSLRASRESILPNTATIWQIEALCDFINTLHDVVKEAKIGNYLIANHLHKFSFVQIHTILDDAEEIFGDGHDTQPLIRTAAFQVFTKQYNSIQKAHTAYTGYLADAKRLFGDGPDTQPLIRTAAVQVFMQKYPAIQEAHTAYVGYLAAAKQVFGDGPDTQPLIRTAAMLVFTKQYNSIQKAHTAYTGYLADAKRLFGDGPDTQPLIRTAAFQVFMQKYPAIQEAHTPYLAIGRARFTGNESR